MVKAVLHLPQLQAAAACGFGLTWVRWQALARTPPTQAPQFKRACRALGIARWPHRKFQSIERAMDACADPVWLNASRETRAQVSRWVHVLEAAEVRRLCHPRTPES